MQETLAFRVFPKDHSKQQSPGDCFKTEHSAQEQFHSSRGHNNSLADMFKVSCSLFREFSEILQISLNSGCHGQYPTTPQLMNIVEGVRYKSTEKVPGPAGIQTQDLLNTSQTLLPLIKSLGPLGRGVEDKLHRHHCPEVSAKFQLILALSELN